MAFVAISRDFMARVNQKISTMRSAEVKVLGEEKPKLALTARDPFFVKTYWGEYASLLPQIPKEWITANDTVNLKFKIPGSDRPREGDNWFDFRATCTSSEGFPIPPRTSYYDNKECDPHDPVMAEILQYALSVHEIDLRWENVTLKVNQFLNACKSANEAIKLWPDVKAYFYEDDIKRLEVKAVRAGSKDSAAAAALAGIDTGEVMSAAVIARLSGASV